MAPRRKIQGAAKRLTLNLEASEHALLERYAESKGLDRADAVRVAVRFFLAVEAGLQPSPSETAAANDPLRRLRDDPTHAMRLARRIVDLALNDRVEPQLDLFGTEHLALPSDGHDESL